MEHEYLIVTVLLATLISSGCMGGGSSDTGLEIGPGGKTITVTSYEVQPQSILAGQGTQVKIGIVNTGGMNSRVRVGLNNTEPENVQGKNVLVNSCPDIFSITRFSSESSRLADTNTSYNLEPGDELELTWTLTSTTENIPLNGYRCPLGFQIPFEYGVDAYQQVETKQNEEVQGATNIMSKTSQGPLNINLETIGSTSEQGPPTFIEGDSMEILLQMENTAPEESSYQGLVELDAPTITSSDKYSINATSCNFATKNGDGLRKTVKIDKEMRLYQGQSRIVRCDFVLDGTLENPSTRGQITANANYTYIKDLGETEIEVEYRG